MMTTGGGVAGEPPLPPEHADKLAMIAIAGTANEILDNRQRIPVIRICQWQYWWRRRPPSEWRQIQRYPRL
jgi:hypothetical protein